MPCHRFLTIVSLPAQDVRRRIKEPKTLQALLRYAIQHFIRENPDICRSAAGCFPHPIVRLITDSHVTPVLVWRLSDRCLVAMGSSRAG